MNKLKIYLSLAMFTLLSVGCSRGNSHEDNGSGGYKDIVYSADMEPSESGSPYVVKGQYTNKYGEVIHIEENVPWKTKLSNVSSGVKAKFDGYIYCTNTKRIIGSVSMLVTEAGGERVIYTTKKEYDLYKESGYTNENIKEATEFSFIEK